MPNPLQMGPGANRLGYNSQGRLTLDGQEMTNEQLYGTAGQQSGAVVDSAQDDAGGYVPGRAATTDWDEFQQLGRHQLFNTHVSSEQEGQGFGEVRASRIPGLQWDPRWGVTTGDPTDIEDPNDPDDAARAGRWRNAILMAMTAGAAMEFAPAMMAGETGASAGAWGLAGESTAEQLAAYQAAMAGEVGSGGGAMLGAGLEDVPASVLGDAAGAGPPNSYWGQLADSGIPVNDAGGGLLEGNMPFEPSLDIPSYSPPPEGTFPETAWSPDASPTNWERFTNDPSFRTASRLSGGNPLSTNYAGDYFGIPDGVVSDQQLINWGLRGVGSYMDQQGQNRRADQQNAMTREQWEAAQLYGMANINDPNYTIRNVQDPTTHQWTRTRARTPEAEAAFQTQLRDYNERMNRSHDLLAPGAENPFDTRRNAYAYHPVDSSGRTYGGYTLGG